MNLGLAAAGPRLGFESFAHECFGFERLGFECPALDSAQATADRAALYWPTPPRFHSTLTP